MNMFTVQVGHSVLEYMYRDAGNWKTHATVLLTGKVENGELLVRSCLDWAEQFIPEQVQLPALHQRHFGTSSVMGQASWIIPSIRFSAFARQNRRKWRRARLSVERGS